jgi:hypothetical protein
MYQLHAEIAKCVQCSHGSAAGFGPLLALASPSPQGQLAQAVWQLPCRQWPALWQGVALRATGDSRMSSTAHRSDSKIRHCTDRL